MACAALVACGGGGGGGSTVGAGDSTAPVAGSEPGVSLPGSAVDLIGTSAPSGNNAQVPSKGAGLGGDNGTIVGGGNGSVVGGDTGPIVGNPGGSPNPGAGAQEPQEPGAPIADRGPQQGGTAPADFLKRPFASDSPWNQPIPANATYRESDPRTKSLRSAGAFGVNSSQWTIWVWHAKESDPLQTINVSVRHLTSSGSANEGNVTIRMPSNAHPDPANDSHMTVIDPDGKHAHEFWYVKKRDGRWTAVSYAKVPLDGSGVNISGYASHNSNYLTYGWGATRAYGGSQIGGLIRKGEATSGSIDHAIAVAIPAKYLGGRAVWPATSDDQSPDYAGVIPMGTRFAIPPSVNVEALGLSPAHLRLARALQKYGLIVVDKSGSPCMYAEGLEAQADGQALNANRSQMELLTSLLTVVE